MTSLRQYFETLEQSQFWPPAQLDAWQRRHLTSLLMHARRTSPFYRFRLDKVFRPNGSIDWDRWHQIPVLTRAQVSDQAKNILSRAPVREHGPFVDVSTSGSTGHPVTVRTTKWLNEMSVACNWRSHQWAGLDWSKTQVAVLGELEGLKVGQVAGTWGPVWDSAARRGKMVYTTYATNNIERLKIMADCKASYLATTPNNMLILTQLAHEKGLQIPLEKIMLRGGKATDFVRAEARDIFGCEAVELYSSKEAGSIAHPCPTGDGWHVNAEAMLFEIVDDAGLPVAPGESGRVVVTPFGSTAFPLIRYDQGDRAIAGGTCSCGRSLPHFKELSGRIRDEFLRADGTVIDNLPDQARIHLGAGQWQVAKIGPDKFEIRYVRKDWGVAPDIAAFHKLFKEVFYEAAEVRVVEMDEVPLSANGKYLEKVVEWSEGPALRRLDIDRHGGAGN